MVILISIKMHELTESKELVKLLEEFSQNGRIKEVTLVLGELTGLKKEPIEFYVEQLKKESEVLKDQLFSLIFIEEKGEVICNSCNKETTIIDPFLFVCENCGSQDVKVKSGKDFLIKEIVFESTNSTGVSPVV
jgi:Zn finger protein HypA/HybF involved in hydrogenase expression